MLVRLLREAPWVVARHVDYESIEKRPQIQVDPGYVVFTREPTLLCSVTGRAVVVCLWDRVRRCGGMAHFVHPHTREPQQATPFYGNVATRRLVQLMEEAGCVRSDIVAQIMGGASREFDFRPRVGEGNVKVARSVLAALGIEVVSSDVGGHVGRKIAFDTQTGESAVLKVHTLRTGDW